MSDFQAIAVEFVKHYYNTFDTDRASLVGLYRDNSMLTFQGSQHLGAASIAEKLVSLPFQKVQHHYNPPDAQPTANGIIVLVTGQLAVDGDADRPLGFSQAFHLVQDPAGQWFVYNDIFNLVVV
ncbi:uncharacterized protein CTHT_0042790 [Thermochaetoides thermophila DSM 1495]|uniref:Nuclear transport factor 2 n=1 Tax=Chaetomium thermophilum (strain DSM 1495 / CBS 144.50 / IMI 039719) TaxID=759272 RepID=G0SAM3_CHATD|nr:hypothetical protein CTHT_0042790 [Thermochaetoides thermophila DSM 1495]EGS19795.1 hypothetical protein CTHT_0042790 [Thermochaetoides thermophila DSM 1495]